MKIAQMSDTHMGITKPKSLRKMFNKMKNGREENPFDIILHNGDFCGGTKGYKTVNGTILLLREFFPDTPIVANIGNHDFWWLGYKDKNRRDENWKYFYPSYHDFCENYEKILAIFKTHNIHFLDEDGPYRHKDFPGTVMVGHTGWYNNPKFTNDYNFLPIGLEGDTYNYMVRRAQNGLYKNLDLLTEKDTKVLFSSHFPVIAPSDWGWFSSIADMMTRDYGTTFFFCGHAHELHQGPLRWECGPDYHKPAYQIVDTAK